MLLDKIPSSAEAALRLQTNAAVIAETQKVLDNDDFYERELASITKDLAYFQARLDRLLDNRKNGAEKLVALHLRRDGLLEEQKMAQQKDKLAKFLDLKSKIAEMENSHA